MASNILTPDIILREALYLLHQKMVFGSMIHRKYEDEFKGSGAKIGDEILIRRPNTYKIRKGRVAQPQNTRERFETLKIDNQVGVDMSFTSRELTLDLDDFSERILQPAIATLVSDLEYQLLSMLRDVPMLYPSDISASDNIYDHSAIYDWVDLCGRELDIELAPKTDRHALLNSYDESQIIDLLKGLFGDSAEISKQFTEGKMRRFQGFSHKRTVHMPVYHPGRSVYKTDLLFGSTNTNTTPITFGSIVEGQSHFPLAASDPNDWRKGDIVTLSNLKKVHPETKRVYRQCNASFVVTKDAIAGQNMEIW
ncbi:MAG: P22 phage major capsid protein family protein, partial [Candidatus Thiodiazotropha sp. 6PLUC7]